MGITRRAAGRPPRPTRRATAPAASSGGRGRPNEREIAAARILLEPWRWFTSPRFYGIERVPARRPVLLAGNHTIMGVLDVPLMVLKLYDRRGFLVRPLGDHAHFRVPVWRDLLTRFGTVDGTRENCRALMRAGESLLVFPGGGREVFKRRGEKYSLIWKNRIGFAKLAIEHGYPIVPFAAVGAEECYDILVDGNDIESWPIGRLVERFSPRPDSIPPLVRGVGLSPLPRPERFYFHFGEPVETAEYDGRAGDERACFAVRERVRTGVEDGIAFLLAERETDPHRQLGARVGKQLKQVRKSVASIARAGKKPGPRRKRRPPKETR